MKCRLNDDVNLLTLAATTKNYSGAEIEGLVKAANSHGIMRCSNPKKMGDFDQEKLAKLKIGEGDFTKALAEFKPSFGVASEELGVYCRNGIIVWGPPVSRVQHEVALRIKQVTNSTRTPLVSILLHGAAGSGKTALATKLALESGFPLVKMVSPDSLVSSTDTHKAHTLNKTFEDAYKSPFSIIVIDEIERLEAIYRQKLTALDELKKSLLHRAFNGDL